jgi:hypothetical protein
MSVVIQEKFIQGKRKEGKALALLEVEEKLIWLLLV